MAEVDPRYFERPYYLLPADEQTAEGYLVMDEALEARSGLAANWLLDLWEVVPTPLRAVRVREATIAKVLKRHRIRRLDAAHVRAVLRKPPVTVAAGTTEAACAHSATLIGRIRLLNQQIGEAHHQLDTLTARLASALPAEPGHVKQRDAEIFASLLGVGRIVLATLLAEASDALQRRDYAALRSLTGVAPVTKRSGKSGSLSAGRPAIGA